MPHLLLEGKADRYQHFLSSASNANLVAVSDDFHFRIQSVEGPSLLIRHVSTHGQVTNHGELSDAFFALMLSYHPGGYSSTGPLSNCSSNPPGPTLHWHFPNRSCINHHHNSKVTYLRLECTALLRELSAQAIAVSQLACLQGVAAPAHLVQLIEDLDRQLAHAELHQHQAITEAFLNRLGQELRLLLGPPKPSDINAAGHTSLAIEWMNTRLGAPINLQQLADAMGLTPRSVQASFKRLLALSPMRWLKLARFSQLRQSLWDRDLAHQSIQQLMGRCGLKDTSLTRQCFKDAYGVIPREERRLAETFQRNYHGLKQDSLQRQFDSPASAIQYLESLQYLDNKHLSSRVAIMITTSAQETNDHLERYQVG